ncbi:hypothetical protein LCL85_19865 [Vibrio alginolyticus]|nr:hypothetical protein [Vibrio alginolyticus]
MAVSKKSQKAAGKAGEKVGRQFIAGLLKIAQERIDNSLDGRIAQSCGDGERVAPKSCDSALEARIARTLEEE